MPAKKLSFDTELRPSWGGARWKSDFPDDNSIGLRLYEKPGNENRFELRIHISKEISEKCGFHSGGTAIGQISDCSTAFRVLFSDTDDADFHGYALKPTGGWKKEKELRKRTGEPQVFNIYMTIPKTELNLNRTKEFPITYVPVIETKKHQLIADISKLSMFVRRK